MYCVVCKSDRWTLVRLRSRSRQVLILVQRPRPPVLPHMRSNAVATAQPLCDDCLSLPLIGLRDSTAPCKALAVHAWFCIMCRAELAGAGTHGVSRTRAAAPVNRTLNWAVESAPLGPPRQVPPHLGAKPVGVPQALLGQRAACGRLLALHVHVPALAAGAAQQAAGAEPWDIVLLSARLARMADGRCPLVGRHCCWLCGCHGRWRFVLRRLLRRKAVKGCPIASC